MSVKKIGDYTPADVYALRAVYEGQASEEQQKRAIKWIMEVASAFKQDPFQDGDPYGTAYVAGRQSVGRHITYLLTLPNELVEKLKDKK